MTEVVESEVQNRSNVVIVDQRPLPKILARKIDEGNQRLNQVQQQIQQDIEEATLELMELMGISREDGWFLDLDGMRFVQLNQDGPVVSSPELESPQEEDEEEAPAEE